MLMRWAQLDWLLLLLCCLHSLRERTVLLLLMRCECLLLQLLRHVLCLLHVGQPVPIEATVLGVGIRLWDLTVVLDEGSRV